MFTLDTRGGRGNRLDGSPWAPRVVPPVGSLLQPTPSPEILSMSLRPRSVLGLLGVLQQQHGLTYTHLAALLAACRARYTGPVVLHVAHGQIRSLELGVRAAPPRLQHD